MLTFSFKPRAESVYISLRMSIEICRLREGLHLCPLECRLSIGKHFREDDEHFVDYKQKRSTEACSKLKSPETRQVQEKLVSTLEHMQVPNWDKVEHLDDVFSVYLVFESKCSFTK